MKDFLKRHSWTILLSLAVLLVDIFTKQIFFTLLLAYWLFLKLLMSDFLSKKFKKYSAIAIWTMVILIFGFGYYVNNYLPYGPMRPTGDYVCENDDRGPCHEEYVEDMRNLDIPDWAKFLRNHGMLLLIGLAVAGIVVNAKNEHEK